MTRDEILKAIREARSGEQQRQAVLALDEHDRQARVAHQASRELDLSVAPVVQQRLTPVAVHEMTTPATDWLMEVTASAPEASEQHVLAEAALWYQRVPQIVRSDSEEFAEQARGMAQRLASQCDDRAEDVRRQVLAYVALLHSQGASGLDQVQQLVDSFEKPKQTPLPQDVFDNFQPPVHPINEGVTGTETSERAPLIQEIMQGDGYGEGPEKPGGHSTSFDGSGGYSEVPAEETEPPRTASLAVNHLTNLDAYREQFAREAADARRADPKEPEPRQAATRKDWPFQENSNTKPKKGRCGWQTGGGLPHDEYCNDEREPGSAYCPGHTEDAKEQGYRPKQAASMLPQVQQATDVHDAPAATPLPTDVAFPWTMSEDEYEGDHPNQQAFAARQRLVASLMAKDPAQLTAAERREVLAFANAVNGRTASVKTADQWTAPHEVPGGQVANSPATTPESTSGSYADGYAEGKSDALAGDAPTYSDASSHAPEFAQGHTQGYSDGVQLKQDHMPKDVPGSMGGQGAQSPGSDAMTNPYADPGGRAHARKVSSLVSTPEAHEHGDFSKGLKYALKWRPGRPIVTQGSAEFEGGLYAGISDNIEHQAAWLERHRVLAKRDPRFADRIDRHARYSEMVAERLGAKLAGPYLRLEAATSTDLDTTAPDTSPSPTGATPINGPGQPGPLAGQEDPAEAGGPAPYNGAPPYGSPVVPSGLPAKGSGTTTIDATVGGPMDQAAIERIRMRPATMAFRKTVQAALVAGRTKEAAGV